MAGKSSFRGDLWEWRYRPSLDLSPWVDSPTTTTSLARLDAECSEQLQALGFCKTDGSHRRSRLDWTGYSREQRRLIKDRDSPAPWRQQPSKADHPIVSFFGF